MSEAISTDNSEHHHGHTHGSGVGAYIKRWLFTTNHKDIGSLYLWFSLLMFFVAGTMALVMRAELAAPGEQFINPNFYNEMVTLHGLIMLFGVVMPAFAGLANWQIPLQIGAPDMALPRLNNFGFWILPFAFILMLSTLFMRDGGPNFGWTMYAPLSTTYAPDSIIYMFFSIHLLGVSSIITGINVITTVLNLRAPGMTLMKMPIFVWTWLITAFLMVVVMPVLAGAVTMMIFDKYFHTSFFEAAGGGDPILFQHIFWFFGHPEVYILILPAFGVMSEVIPTFARKRLFGYPAMVYAVVCIAGLSFIVWAHHMFTTGIPLGTELFFMYTTMLIAVPTGIKVFNWVATCYKGSITFEAPMLFAIAFLFMFTFGGFTGLMLSLTPADYQYQDTYFVVGHFHYVLVPGAIFALFAGTYYWFPKWTGRMYCEKLAQWHFWLTVISLNVTFFPMHFLGLAGMPRRIPDYALQFENFNLIISIGAFVFGFSQLLFAYNVIHSTCRGKKVTEPKVWEGAIGLEWTVPTPAPHETFQTPPHFESE